jgi:hypothetical protein
MSQLLRYLNFLEQNLNAHQCRLIMLSNFNVLNDVWINGVPLPNSYYCNKIEGNAIHTATYFLCLDQRNNSIANSALFDLIF